MKALIMAYFVIVTQLILPANDRRGTEVIKAVSSFKLSESWRTLTDTFEVVLPRNTVEFNEGKFKEILQTGDEIKMYSGYDTLNLEFEGFVTKISEDIPIVIKCEDYMWKLKQMPAKFSLKNTSLLEILTVATKGLVPIDALDLQLPKYTFRTGSVAKLLTELKDKYGIFSYMKSGTLVSGKIYSDDLDQERVKFEIGINTPIEGNNLEYRDPNQVNLKVKVESIQRNGSKIFGTAGDDEGEEILDKVPYLNQAQADEFAERRLKTALRGGFTGSFEAFAMPRVQHGQIIDLFNPVTGLGGFYFVDSVELEMDDSPKLHQKITIGIEAT
jgi:hypothetical protein